MGGRNTEHCTARPGASVSGHLECLLPRQEPVKRQRGGPPFSFRTSRSRGAGVNRPSLLTRHLHSQFVLASASAQCFSVWRCHPPPPQQMLPKRSLSARHSAEPSGWDKQTRPRHPGKEGDAEGTPARRAPRLPGARTSPRPLRFGSRLHLLPLLAPV